MAAGKTPTDINVVTAGSAGHDPLPASRQADQQTFCFYGNQPETSSETSCERPPESGLVIRQPRRGYRYNQDPFHLARFILHHQTQWRTQLAGEILDLGCGVGVIALLLAEKLPDSRITGVEIQPELAALARENCEHNRLPNPPRIIETDYRTLAVQSDQGRRYSLVVSNPPYYPPGDGRLNRCPQKTMARHEIAGNLEELLAAAAFFLRDQGIFALVFPSERLSELIAGLTSIRLETKFLQFIHPRERDRAGMFLLAARKNGASGLIVENPVYI